MGLITITPSGAAAMDDLQDTDARPDSYRVTADELRQFIERFERLESEKNATSPTSRKRLWPRPRRAATTPR